MKGGLSIIRKKSLKALMEKAKKQPTMSLGYFIRNKTKFSFVAIAVFSMFYSVSYLCGCFNLYFPLI